MTATNLFPQQSLQGFNFDRIQLVVFCSLLLPRGEISSQKARQARRSSVQNGLGLQAARSGQDFLTSAKTQKAQAETEILPMLHLDPVVVVQCFPAVVCQPQLTAISIQRVNCILKMTCRPSQHTEFPLGLVNLQSKKHLKSISSQLQIEDVPWMFSITLQINPVKKSD